VNIYRLVKEQRLDNIDRWIALFGGTELMALDVLAKTEKTPGHRKNTVSYSGAP